MQKIAIALLLGFIFCCGALYVQTDDKGNTIYSDTPLSTNAKKIDVKGASNTTTQQTNTAANAVSSPVESNTVTTNDTPLKTNYKALAISSPQDQETFQNQPVIAVDVSTEPKLKKGDKIQLYVDGTPYSRLIESTHFELNHIDRGAHQLYVVLIGANNNIKQSKPITIYVHYGTASSAPK